MERAKRLRRLTEQDTVYINDALKNYGLYVDGGSLLDGRLYIYIEGARYKFNVRKVAMLLHYYLNTDEVIINGEYFKFSI